MREVERTLKEVQDWIRVHQSQFSFEKARSHRDSILLLKPFSEYVLTLSILARHGHLNFPELLHEAWLETGEGNYLMTLLQARPDLIELEGLVESFASSGYVQPELIQSRSQRLGVMPASQE